MPYVIILINLLCMYVCTASLQTATTWLIGLVPHQVNHYSNQCNSVGYFRAIILCE